LGSGVEQVYPWENKGLAQKIVAEGGGLVSEFLPWTEAAKYRFPQRNRIMSGLSQATLLLEAGRKSGALGTCHWALEHNRELFVLPPIFDSEKFLGNAYMIQQGATLLSRLEDLSLTEARQPSLFGQWTDLSPAQQRIMPKVSENGIHKEDLAQLLGWELPELELELFRLTQQGLLLEGRNNFIFRRENL
jgi:DNA processing protein